ncbi:MAG: cohesin domain-containing protein, partial [Candidatus Methanospirare jalkutatii]|nr:cohesin domain-containing protein [Candidatus Methanospirare jalkutatii]
MKKCMLMAVLAVVLLLATNASAQIPDFTASGKATVSIEPASTPGLRPGDAFSVNVTVDPAGRGINGAEVKIAFDATVVECEDVSPGNLLGERPLEGKKEIDNENGMVWYKLYRRGSTPVPTEEGTFAVLSFKVKEDAPEGTYYLKISSAELTDENFNYISPIEIKNGTFTIVPAPANITFSDLRVAPTEGDAPLDIVVCASVENIGGSAGTYNATLKIDGEVVDYKTGTLSAGESKSVCFNYTFTETGTYNVTIDGLPPVEVNVREKVVPTVSIEPASTKVCPGDVFSVNVTVDPAGKGVSAADVKIVFDATVVECEDVSPGDLLGEHPLEGKKEIDNENGMVWYALARIGDTPVPTEEGTFAVLSFKVKEDAPEGT